jgi:hypothetical protein
MASLDRMVDAVENVRRRLLRASAALRDARVDYAIAGGNAVGSWVSRVDPGAVRNTPDVNILLRRSDLPAARTAMEGAGFVYRHIAGIDMFLDGPAGRPRDGVHILFADERVRPTDAQPHPSVTESEEVPGFRVISLEALVRIKLIANRDKDRTHLRDMLDVGLIDASWLPKLPPALAQRFQHLLDTPGE